MSNDYDEEVPAAASGKTRFGVVALVGRPNAGKSTLLNHLLEQKVSIVSNKPQTTRNRIVGILNETRGQIAFLDTPGIHKPLHRMNMRMMEHVRSAIGESDVVCAVIDVSQEFGHGDEFVVQMLRDTEGQGATRVAVLNKIDLLKKEKLLPLLQKYGEMNLFQEIVPISAATGDGVDILRSLLFSKLPEAEARYPQEDYTTQPERFFAAELIREKLLHHTSQELPYTTAVAIDRWEEEEDNDLIRIYASIFVERESQKPIVIGKGGEMVKRIGTEARQEIEAILGTRVFLDIHIAVHESWREDERFLGELDWPLRGSE